ncbi:MAG TPA: EAL domain-containing response regulator [Casimicrobiaceae bacterium]|nr:EAL domain-containing response regulator [Casimicrobiaceae bacterium]
MQINPAIRRILVLDDDAFILKTVSHALGRLGYPQVVTTSSAVQALTLLSDDGNAIDFVLCDLNMPEMDGIEFLRELADRGFAGGVALISGEDSRTLKTAEDLARARRLTVVGVIEKPVRAEALEALLAQWRTEAQEEFSLDPPPVTPEELRRAIEAGEFVAFFQPQIELATGWVAAVEALARWKSPGKGMLLPDAFISVAEQHGLIGPLTERIMADALGNMAAWRSRGLQLRMALNVSVENLKELDFPDRVLAGILAAGVSPASVILEITESRFMANPVAAMDTLVRLRLKKIRLSIDDFGTGYASLAQLRDIPFDELKVDRTFVRGAAQDEAARTILEASIALGQKLGMSVVAEGVNNQEDWDRVARLGCHLAQGNFMAQPMPGADIPAWVDAWNARHMHR